MRNDALHRHQKLCGMEQEGHEQEHGLEQEGCEHEHGHEQEEREQGSSIDGGASLFFLNRDDVMETFDGACLPNPEP